MTTNPTSLHQHQIEALAAATQAKHRTWALVASLAAVYLIWSSTYLGMKIAIATFPPLVLGTVRFLLAGTILFSIHLLRGGRLPTRKELLAAAPIGMLMFIAGNGFIGIAQHEVASGVTAIVAATTPLWAALLGPLFGEHARRAEWIGVALGTLGVALLAAQSDLGSNWGMILVLLLAPVGWSLGTLLARKRAQAPGLAAPALHMLWGGVGMLVLSPLIGESWPASIPAEAWGVVAYLVVAGSLIGFTAFHWLLKNTRPSLALSYSYVNPAIAVLLGVVFGGEPLHATTIAATAILVVAVAVVVRGALSRRSARPAMDEVERSEA